MKAVVVYESIYGNTHQVAEAIAAGLRESAEVTLVAAHDAGADTVDGVDMVVVGGPTHAHGMTRAATRKAAVDAGRKPGLTIEPGAEEEGVREWLDGLTSATAAAAAFDTRMDAPAVLTGRASTGIAKGLRHHGYNVIAEESFLLAKGSDVHLAPDEESRARVWGAQLATKLAESLR